jgi:sugar phosphate isomerase/epimerase
MHPRIAVHEVCFPASWDFETVLSMAEHAGIERIGLATIRHQDGWSEAVARINATPIAVPYLCHASMFAYDRPSTWDASTRRLIDTIDAAVAVGAATIYTTTGPAGRLDFDDAVEALSRAVAPALEYAKAAGVALLTETANPFYAGSHFLHTLQDTIDATAAAGLGICLDVHAVWRERDLLGKIRAASGQIGLVQVSDFIAGNVGPARDVIGDGLIPLAGILAAVLETGYPGTIDLELVGRPEATVVADILVSIERLTTILDSLKPVTSTR